MAGDDDWFDDEEEIKTTKEKDKSKEVESFEETFDDVGDDGDDDGDEFADDEDYDDEEGGEKKKKRIIVEDQNKFIQLDGTIIVTKRDEKGLPCELAIDTGKIRYPIQMDTMGKQLLKFCFNQVFIGGILKAEGATKVFEVKNFI